MIRVLGITRTLIFGCELCGERLRCWRWHVEFFTCPTCKHEVSEFEPAAQRVVDATWPDREIA